MNTKPMNVKKWTRALPYLLCAVLCVLLFFAQPSVAQSNVRFWLAMAFQCLVLGALALALFRVSYAWLTDLGYHKRQIRCMYLFVLAFCVASAIFLFFHFRSERDIKIYDYAVYWVNVLENRALIAESIPDYFVNLHISFGYEYNYLAAFPLLPLSYILGTSFGGYCLSIIYAYYLPACFFLALFSLRLAKRAFNNTPKLFHFFLCFSICALSVGLLWPVMNGYVDIAGVLIIALMLNITLFWHGISFDWKRNIALSLLSLALLLLRRWYAYYIVGFYFALLVNVIIAMVRMKRRRMGKFPLRAAGHFLANMAMIAATSTILMFLVNKDLFRLFLRNYRLAYSAYKSMNLWENLWGVIQNMGVFFIVACCAGAFLLLRSRNSRMVTIRLLVSMTTAVIMFTFVQDLNLHHQYLLLPTLLIMICGFAVYVNEYLFERKIIVGTASMVLLCLMNFCYGYVPQMQAIALMTEPFTTTLYNYPKNNPEYDTIVKIVEDIDRKVSGTSDKLYVVGDGNVLSPELLMRSHLPESTDAAPFAFNNCIVDLRDGFPSHLFFAEYVLLTNPFYTSMQEKQQVSFQVYDMFMHDPVVAEYYELDANYGGINYEYLLFRKKVPMTTECVDVLKQRLFAFYPDDPFVYEPNDFIALCQVLDEAEHDFDFYSNRSMRLKKYAGVPLRLKWNVPSAAKQVSFHLSSKRAGSLEMVVENEEGVLYTSSIETVQDSVHTFEIAGSKELMISFRDDTSAPPFEAALVLYGAELS